MSPCRGFRQGLFLELEMGIIDSYIFAKSGVLERKIPLLCGINHSAKRTALISFEPNLIIENSLRRLILCPGSVHLKFIHCWAFERRKATKG